MVKSQFGRALVVEYDLSDSLSLSPAGHGDHWDRNPLVPRRVDRDQSFHRPSLQKQGVFFDQVRFMTMTGYQVKVPFLQEFIFDPAHHRRGITFAHLGYQDADHKTTLRTQGSGDKVGPVIEMTRRGEDAVLRLLRNRVRHWRSV